MTKEGLFNQGLPKWPQMLVTGIPVSKEQAMEIIRRTDAFFTGYSGNNRNFNRMVRQELNIPVQDYNSYPGCKEYSEFNEYWEARNAWLEHWGFIKTEYVYNTWISCSYIFGAHGWCHPDGNIGYVDNIGKWPSIEEVYNDWIKIAKEFPFLNIGVTLMEEEAGFICSDAGIALIDGEEMDNTPVVSFIVKNGSVDVVDPKKINVHKNHPVPTRSKGVNFTSSNLYCRNENAIPMSEICKWKKFLN